MLKKRTTILFSSLLLAGLAALPVCAQEYDEDLIHFPRPAPPVRHAARAAGGELFLQQVSLDEAARMISQIKKSNIVVSSSVADKKVSLYLSDINVEGMVKSLARAAGAWYRRDPQTSAYILMSAEEYRQDLAITRDETTRQYVLRHHNVVSIANAVHALFGSRVNLVEPIEEMPPVEIGGTGRNNETSINYGAGSGNNNYGNNRYGGYGGKTRQSGSMVNADGTYNRSFGGTASRNQQQVDVRKAVDTLSQEGLDAAFDIDSSQTTRLDGSAVLAATSNLGPPINVTYNKLHNLLLVRTSDESALADIDKMVVDMDHPPRQVLLEMRIIEVTLGNDFRSVFDIGFSSNSQTKGPYSPVNGTTREEFPRNAAALGNFASLSNPTAIWQIVNDNLLLRLQLLESKNRVNVLATPMLVAANNQPARLFIGDEQILVTGASANSHMGTTGATNTTITVETERRNVGQTLVILPRINADRSVTLTIDQDNSRVNSGGAILPLATANGEIHQFPIDTVNTANLQVTAHARDGLTVAIGGMISQTVTDAQEKVPLLGDIPVLGVLFKKTVRDNTRKQIVLLITPRVLETPEEGDTLAHEKESGVRGLDDSSKETPTLGGPRQSIFDDAPEPETAPGSPGDNTQTDPATRRINRLFEMTQ